MALCGILAIFTACGPKGFQLKGTLQNAPNLTVYFDAVNPMSRTNNVIAKGETNASGKFIVNMEEAPQPGVYRVRVGAKSAYLVLDGKESDITIVGDINTLSKFQYAVAGSDLSDEYAREMQLYFNGGKGINEISEYVKNDADGLIAMLAGIQLFGANVEYAELHQTISERAKEQYPDSELTGEYKTFADAMQKEFLRQQSMSKVQIGADAPDIELPGPDGKMRKLSDLKGNIVLLDFWAAWCRPCRMENPNVVRVYDKYKDKGFTVFSVSLDGLDDRTKRRYPEDQLERQLRNQKDRWVGAIKQDNLKWDSHVSDLKKWDSKGAAIYGVRAIPQTFLVDRDGKIAAINPRRNLEQAVQRLIAKASEFLVMGNI